MGPTTQPPDAPMPVFVSSPEEAFRMHAPARRREPVLRYVVLFLLTVATTMWAGRLHFLSYALGFSNRTLVISPLQLTLQGLWYTVSILSILGAHEFGHYFACRYYRVDASIPYFLPAPLPLTGTLGAFIRIRQPIPGKRALFDIGIAGPLAGFIVAVPVLLLGMAMSKVVTIPPTFRGTVYQMGEPLLFKAAAWLTFGSLPDSQTVSLHPVAFGAWFGLLATALNLFPIGQLDGGHISYAVLGRRSLTVTIATVVCLLGLCFVSTSWIVWTVLTVSMLASFGPRHPPVYDEDMPLDPTRVRLALFSVFMFAVCFTPAPLELMDLVGGR